MGLGLIEPDFALLRLLGWRGTPLFLDIGANRGLATDAMRLLVPSARIIAFEPNPLLHRQLTRLYRTVGAVECLDIALGDASRDAILWVPVYRNWIFDGLGSLNRGKAADWLNSDRLYFFNRRHIQLREYTCRIRRLDELGLAPAFIKIDVQGHGLAVLRGAEQTLRRCRPLVMIENTDRDAEANFLKGLGYTICAFEENRLRVGQAGELNSFFLSAEHLRQLGKRHGRATIAERKPVEQV